MGDQTDKTQNLMIFIYMIYDYSLNITLIFSKIIFPEHHTANLSTAFKYR